MSGAPVQRTKRPNFSGSRAAGSTRNGRRLLRIENKFNYFRPKTPYRDATHVKHRGFNTLAIFRIFAATVCMLNTCKALGRSKFSRRKVHLNYIEGSVCPRRRPMKSPNPKTFIALRIKPATLDALQKVAAEADETFSSVTRRILENYISRR
jgi:hypothetical protein